MNNYYMHISFHIQKSNDKSINFIFYKVFLLTMIKKHFSILTLMY